MLYTLCIKQIKLLKKYTTIEWMHNSYKNKMDTISMNSKSSKTSNPHILILIFADKKNKKK